MHNFRNHIRGGNYRSSVQLFLLLLLTGLFSFKSTAQNCPPNIDFETGTFSGWTCYTGSVAASGNENIISLLPSGPVGGQHEMYSASSANNLFDAYGGFPVLCPNGSSHSIKLGNVEGGAQAEGISYEFTIPANRNTYSLIYNYAVVFQDPTHQPYQQPRLVLEVTDVTDNEPISCSSFTFFPNGSPLPGFFMSPLSDSVAVWCKDWSAVTINLNGKAGKTIRLFFKTADCTFRRHFGYAYIDVNSECSSEFVGATYCPDDTAITVIAPYGYQNYTWFNSTFTQVLGTQQSIGFSPPPPPGTTIAVEIVPYNGYGCLDTLYAQLVDTLNLVANAGPDTVSCNKSPVMIGQNPKPGVLYSWSPATALSNPNIANPRAGPAVTTSYILTIHSSGGGCVSKDTVVVTASVNDSTLQLLGKSAFCITSTDSAVLVVQPTDSIQWFRNNTPIIGATQTRYRVNQSGTYYAVLFNDKGCSIATRTQQVLIETPRPGIDYPLQFAVVNYPLQLQARTFGTSVVWNPSINLDDPAVVNPVYNSPVITDQLYTIQIKTAAGCLTTDRQLIKTIKEVKVYVPTGFTPDNNGVNDFFRPLLFGIKELRYFNVYNRWGQLVYSMQPGHAGWNGKINGTEQPGGVYIWIFSGLGLDNKIYTQKGTTVLIR